MIDYVMLKCRNCGHMFKSNVTTKQTRCSKCGKSSFIKVDAINEAALTEIKILQDQVKILESWVICTTTRIGALEHAVNGLLLGCGDFDEDADELPLEIISQQLDNLRKKAYEKHGWEIGSIFDKEEED